MTESNDRERGRRASADLSRDGLQELSHEELIERVVALQQENRRLRRALSPLQRAPEPLSRRAILSVLTILTLFTLCGIGMALSPDARAGATRAAGDALAWVLPPEPTFAPLPAPEIRPTATPEPSPTVPPTATPIVGARDQDAPGIAYDGWRGGEDPAASGGSYRAASEPGREINLDFTIATTEITLLGYRGPDQGTVQLWMDNEKQEPIDLYAPEPAYGPVATFQGLPLGTHRLRLRVIDERNPASTGNEVRVDAFELLDAVQGTTVRIEESDRSLRFGNWAGVGDPNAIDGGYRQSGRQARATFRFNGTGFTWFTLRCSNCGQAQILVDGEELSLEDLYRPEAEWRAPIEISGLPDGEHVAEIVVLGSRNEASNGSRVVIDAIRPGIP